MKRLLSVVSVLAVLSSTAFAATPLKVGIFGPVAYPNTDEVKGLEIGILGAKASVTGVQLGGIVAFSEGEIKGVQLSYIYAKTEDMTGLQMSFVDSAGTCKGVQYGFVNLAENITGVQLGFVNLGDDVSGLQFGFWNRATSMGKGVQLGFINIIKDSSLPVMIFANAKF